MEKLKIKSKFSFHLALSPAYLSELPFATYIEVYGELYIHIYMYIFVCIII